MIFDASRLSPGDFYRAMLQSIIPRPVAWVLSSNPNGSYNVAPFSFFNGVSAEPPILMIAVGMKDDTTRKDTWVNIDERDAFVVHIPPVPMADAMVATSKAYPFEVSELDAVPLKTVAVEGEELPRIDGPKVAMFCRKHKIVEVGTERIGLILGEIKKIWVDDAIVRVDGRRAVIDPLKIDPVARLGLLSYSALGNVWDIQRPK